MQYDLGYFDHETCKLEPIENPFSVKVLPMSTVYSVTHVSGMDPASEVDKMRLRTTVERPLLAVSGLSFCLI